MRRKFKVLGLVLACVILLGSTMSVPVSAAKCPPYGRPCEMKE